MLQHEDRIETDPNLEEDEQRVRLRMIVARAKGDEPAFREARKDLERLDAEIDWNS